MAAGQAPWSRSQLPGRARGGLARLGGVWVRGTLYRDRDSQLPSFGRAGSRGGVQRRAERLEESLRFLRQQHKETLQQLHSEAERLKKENRELSFRVVMCRCDQPTPSNGSGTTPPPGRGPCCAGGGQPWPAAASGELRVRALEEEVQQLRQALAEERQSKGRMLQLLGGQLGTSSASRGRAGGDDPQLGGEGVKAHELSWARPADLQPRATGLPLLVSEGPGGGKASLVPQESIKCPPLKPRVVGCVAERQRRRLAVQRRLSGVALPPLQPPSLPQFLTHKTHYNFTNL
jgi:hypothetical protein